MEQQQQRRRAKVLFITIPDTGHLHPLLSVAKQLAAHGAHDVAFATLEHGRAKVEGCGVRFVSTGVWTPAQLEYYAGAVRHTFDAATPAYQKLTGAAGAQIELCGLTIAQGLLAHLEACPADTPDVMVTDSLTLAGYDVAERLRIPLAVVAQFPLSLALLSAGHNAYNMPADVPFESMVCNLPPARGLLLPLLKRLYAAGMHAMFSGPRNRVRRQLQLPPVRGFAMQPQPGVPRLLHLCAGSWVLNAKRALPPDFHVVGPMGLGKAGSSAWGPKDADTLAFLQAAEDAGEPVVYVATGTMVTLTQRQVAAMASAFTQLAEQHSARIIWSLREPSHALLPPQLRPAGSGAPAPAAGADAAAADDAGRVGGDAASEAQCSAGDSSAAASRVLVQAWVNQQAVLNHAQVKAFVTHGGMGSTCEGLAAGKPLLCLPFMGDQPTVAAQVVRAGVGLSVHPVTMTAAALLSALQRLLTKPQFAAAAAAAGAAIAAEDGAATAVQLLSAFAAECVV